MAQRRVATTWTVLLVAASLATGCQYGAYFFRPTHRPMHALEVRMDPGARRSCLVVMMPGMLNVPDTYLDRGFIADAVQASRRCDILSADAHFGYYREGTVARGVGRDILRVAEQRGYEDIWLVGSSMGAMGALMVARENPERVDGIVLFGPYFGGEALIRSIRSAGGLARWHAPEGRVPAHGDPRLEELWEWLRGYVTNPDAMPPLYVAVGDEDGMRRGAELLTAHLPPSHSGLAEGGHAWATWRVMWRRLLVSPPWDPGSSAPRIDR